MAERAVACLDCLQAPYATAAAIAIIASALAVILTATSALTPVVAAGLATALTATPAAAPPLVAADVLYPRRSGTRANGPDDARTSSSKL